MPTLSNWKYSLGGVSIRLLGVVNGHAELQDGDFIITSPIVKSLGGNSVETRSGTQYQLESPSPPKGVSPPQYRENFHAALREMIQ